MGKKNDLGRRKSIHKFQLAREAERKAKRALEANKRKKVVKKKRRGRMYYKNLEAERARKRAEKEAEKTMEVDKE
jgi:hypothetical protein